MHVSHSIKLSCEGFTVILRQVLPEFNQDDGCHMSQLVFWDFFPRAPHSQEHFAQISAATLSHSLSQSFFFFSLSISFISVGLSLMRGNTQTVWSGQVWSVIALDFTGPKSWCVFSFFFFRFARQLFHLLKCLKQKKSRAVSQFKIKLIRLY